jgi:hypothetical protein
LILLLSLPSHVPSVPFTPLSFDLFSVTPYMPVLSLSPPFLLVSLLLPSLVSPYALSLPFLPVGFNFGGWFLPTLVAPPPPPPFSYDAPMTTLQNLPDVASGGKCGR